MIYGGLFDLDNKLKRKEELELIVNSPSFWNSDDREKILKENNSLNELINRVIYTKNKVDSNLEMLNEELDDELFSLINAEYDEVKVLIDKLRIDTYLSGEFDKNDLEQVEQEPFRLLEKKEYNAIPETERLTSEDLEQGTVTVSNIGSTYLGQKGAMTLLEIVPPQVCAFGVGAVQKKPVVTDNDEIEVRRVLPICIAFDHRALDFGDIVPFMKKLDEIFSSPEVIFSWRKEERKLRRFSA